MHSDSAVVDGSSDGGGTDAIYIATVGLKTNLIDAFVTAIGSANVITDTKVTNIAYSMGSADPTDPSSGPGLGATVTVTPAGLSTKTTYTAQAVLVTSSLGYLFDNKATLFTPTLDTADAMDMNGGTAAKDKLAAINALGMGYLEKVRPTYVVPPPPPWGRSSAPSEGLAPREARVSRRQRTK